MHLIENISFVRLKLYYYLDWVDINITSKISMVPSQTKKGCKTNNIIPNLKKILHSVWSLIDRQMELHALHLRRSFLIE